MVGKSNFFTEEVCPSKTNKVGAHYNYVIKKLDWKPWKSMEVFEGLDMTILLVGLTIFNIIVHEIVFIPLIVE